MSRSSANYKIYLNGSLQINVTSFAKSDLFGTTAWGGTRIFLIGGVVTIGSAFNGLFHGLRVTKGIDRYSGGAPSIPTYDMHPAYGVAA